MPSFLSNNAAVRGYLFPVYGTNPENILVRVKNHRSRQSFPEVDFDSVFINQDAASQIHSIVVSVGAKKYIVGGYLHSDGDENQSLSSLNCYVKWQGEIAVVGLGSRVQFLSLPAGPMESIKAAVSLFMTRIIEGNSLGMAIPKQISIDRELALSLGGTRRRRTRNRRTVTFSNAEVPFDT